MTNSVSRRRAIGLAAAIVVLLAIAAYYTWRLEEVIQAGWAGFAYVPPITSRATAPSSTSLSPVLFSWFTPGDRRSAPVYIAATSSGKSIASPPPIFAV